MAALNGVVAQGHATDPSIANTGLAQSNFVNALQKYFDIHQEAENEVLF